jgi:hypothetical protein
MKNIVFLSGLVILFFLAGCKKNPDIIPDNDAPYYDKVPTVLVNNYVNRLFIDIIGREPLDIEMEVEVKKLRDNELSMKSREKLIDMLMTDTTYRVGDSSYFIAYYKRLYDLNKARTIEGASNAYIMSQWGIYHGAWIKDSILGNLTGMAEKEIQMKKLTDIISSEFEYREKEIELNDVYKRMIYNYFFDIININTFNFINASFDDLYFRFPSKDEFFTAFDIIEYNQSSVIFGKPAQNKEDYIDIITDTKEFYEGMIVWVYKTLLSREPSGSETFDIMQTFYTDHNLQEVQKRVLMTDEYANFN